MQRDSAAWMQYNMTFMDRSGRTANPGGLMAAVNSRSRIDADWINRGGGGGVRALCACGRL